MRVLVTGRDGQIAQALLQAGGDRVIAFGRSDLDITRRTDIERAIADNLPDIVVNAAAYTFVDRAESEAERAFAVNRDGARNVAAAAAEAGLPVIQISTDYVFSGEQARPYLETDETGPRGVYGQSKLEGEHVVAQANPAHLILRTSWVHALWGNNFLRTMLRLAGERDTLRIVADQHGAPTYAPDIADALLTVADIFVEAGNRQAISGVYHLTNRGQTTWAGFAEAIFAASSALGGPSAKVEPIATHGYPTAARRPANSLLDGRKLRDVFGIELRDWREATNACVRRILA